ncbi:50S ribosomal protein L21 [Spirochaetota bacterium]
MYAIVEIGGKQYNVEKGTTINIEKVDKKENDKMALDKVLLLSDGKKVHIGQPYVKNADVVGKVLGQIKGDKVRGLKFKKRKNYSRLLGHRQLYTQLKIEKLGLKTS